MKPSDRQTGYYDPLHDAMDIFKGIFLSDGDANKCCNRGP
jgi:hypothetical protein